MPAVTECIVRVASVSEYLNAINQAYNLLCDPEDDNCKLWFRGQVREEFDLIPSIARGGRTPELETAYLSQFKSYVIPYVEDLPASPSPNGIPSYWNWLFLMQHYGVPTRLLDWTLDALTALFFATDPTDPSIQEGTDAAVWVLNPNTLNESFIFHENLAPGYIPNVEEPEFNILFGPDARVFTTLKPAAAIGPLNSTRIVAQRGVFTVFPKIKDLIPLNQFEDASEYLFKICIASESFEEVRTQLRRYGVTRIALFPEIQTIADEIRQTIG